MIKVVLLCFYAVLFAFEAGATKKTSIAPGVATVETVKKKVVIAASYRKFYDIVLKKIDYFEERGDKVLSPPKSRVVDPKADFVRLEDGLHLSDREIEESFLAALKEADLVYVVNPNGYIGLSGAFEIGFAHAIGKKIVCMEKPADPTMAMFCSPDLG